MASRFLQSASVTASSLMLPTMLLIICNDDNKTKVQVQQVQVQQEQVQRDQFQEVQVHEVKKVSVTASFLKFLLAGQWPVATKLVICNEDEKILSHLRYKMVKVKKYLPEAVFDAF